MRTALTNSDSFDLRAAIQTRLSFAVVGSKIILELSAAIYPIYGCAVAADALFQHSADRVMQRFSLFRRDRT